MSNWINSERYHALHKMTSGKSTFSVSKIQGLVGSKKATNHVPIGSLLKRYYKDKNKGNVVFWFHDPVEIQGRQIIAVRDKEVHYIQSETGKLLKEKINPTELLEMISSAGKDMVGNSPKFHILIDNQDITYYRHIYEEIAKTPMPDRLKNWNVAEEGWHRDLSIGEKAQNVLNWLDNKPIKAVRFVDEDGNYHAIGNILPRKPAKDEPKDFVAPAPSRTKKNLLDQVLDPVRGGGGGNRMIEVQAESCTNPITSTVMGYLTQHASSPLFRYLGSKAAEQFSAKFKMPDFEAPMQRSLPGSEDGINAKQVAKIGAEMATDTWMTVSKWLGYALVGQFAAMAALYGYFQMTQREEKGEDYDGALEFVMKEWMSSWWKSKDDPCFWLGFLAGYPLSIQFWSRIKGLAPVSMSGVRGGVSMMRPSMRTYSELNREAILMGDGGEEYSFLRQFFEEFHNIANHPTEAEAFRLALLNSMETGSDGLVRFSHRKFLAEIQEAGVDITDLRVGLDDTQLMDAFTSGRFDAEDFMDDAAQLGDPTRVRRARRLQGPPERVTVRPEEPAIPADPGTPDIPAVPTRPPSPASYPGGGRAYRPADPGAPGSPAIPGRPATPGRPARPAEFDMRYPEEEYWDWARQARERGELSDGELQALEDYEELLAAAEQARRAPVDAAQAGRRSLLAGADEDEWLEIEGMLNSQLEKYQQKLYDAMRQDVEEFGAESNRIVKLFRIAHDLRKSGKTYKDATEALSTDFFESLARIGDEIEVVEEYVRVSNKLDDASVVGKIEDMSMGKPYELGKSTVIQVSSTSAKKTGRATEYVTIMEDAPITITKVEKEITVRGQTQRVVEFELSHPGLGNPVAASSLDEIKRLLKNTAESNKKSIIHKLSLMEEFYTTVPKIGRGPQGSISDVWIPDSDAYRRNVALADETSSGVAVPRRTGPLGNVRAMVEYLPGSPLAQSLAGLAAEGTAITAGFVHSLDEKESAATMDIFKKTGLVKVVRVKNKSGLYIPESLAGQKAVKGISKEETGLAREFHKYFRHFILNGFLNHVEDKITTSEESTISTLVGELYPGHQAPWKSDQEASKWYKDEGSKHFIGLMVEALENYQNPNYRDSQKWLGRDFGQATIYKEFFISFIQGRNFKRRVDDFLWGEDDSPTGNGFVQQKLLGKRNWGNNPGTSMVIKAAQKTLTSWKIELRNAFAPVDTASSRRFKAADGLAKDINFKVIAVAKELVRNSGEPEFFKGAKNLKENRSIFNRGIIMSDIREAKREDLKGLVRSVFKESYYSQHQGQGIPNEPEEAETNWESEFQSLLGKLDQDPGYDFAIKIAKCLVSNKETMRDLMDLAISLPELRQEIVEKMREIDA